MVFGIGCPFLIRLSPSPSNTHAQFYLPEEIFINPPDQDEIDAKSGLPQISIISLSKSLQKKDLFRGYVDQTIAHWQTPWPWKTDTVT